MDFRDLEYFCVVAEHRHVGRAAEALGLTQPAVSLSLRRLERSMRTRLVARNARGVELTPTGTALLARVRSLLLAREEVMREVADLGTGRSGCLHVGVVPGIAEDLAGAAGAILLRDAPTAILKVTRMAAHALAPALRNGEVDLYIASVGGGASVDLAHEKLWEDRYVVYAAAGHRLARRNRVAFADLVGERWAVSTALSSWERLARVFEEKRLPVPCFALDSDSPTTCLSAIAASDLLGIGSRRFVAQSMRRFKLSILSLGEILPVRTSSVWYRRNGYLAPIAGRYIEILKQAAGEMPAVGAVRRSAST